MCALKSSLDRFQGCLVGALIGDCLGAPFEGQCWSGKGGVARDGILHIIQPDALSKKKRTMTYTDDTAMSKSISASLLHCKKFDAVDMAERFTKEFMHNRNRGYGGGVRDIFLTWDKMKINLENVLEPSIEQFGGTGSYGNGGAMRVAPVALFAKSTEECIELARSSARLTHNHQSGYMGAILQALAVYQSLYSTGKINWLDFLNNLKKEMAALESDMQSDVESKEMETEDTDGLDAQDLFFEWTRSKSFSYTKQLDVIEEMLTTHYKDKQQDDCQNVIERLGRDVSAQQAVPTAVYCFLRNLECGFEETLYYTYSLGGDTDTIGTMCAAMAGAYYGHKVMPSSWKTYCEFYKETKAYAEKFYKLHEP